VGERAGRRVGAAAAVLVALSLLALFGTACGNTASDPFLGTWQEQGSKSPWVIGKPGADYQVTFNLGTWGHAERDGDVLHCWAGAQPQVGKEMYLTYQPKSGELLLTDPAGPGVHILMRKASDSTAVPSPFPGGVGNAFSTP
jgi:hypothetical protein